jgi:Transglycosylase SLT domain
MKVLTPRKPRGITEYFVFSVANKTCQIVILQYHAVDLRFIRALDDGPEQDAHRTQIRYLPRWSDDGTRKRHAMTALTAAIVLTLAAQWGQPVAPKTIVAEATVESRLDPLAIHDNTTGRTFHPATVEDAIRIAMRLDAAGGNYDVGLMQINRANFDWLHLTLAGAPRSTALDRSRRSRHGVDVALKYRQSSRLRERLRRE